MAGGRLDAAIVNKPLRALALEFERIFDEEMVLTTGPAYAAELAQDLALGQRISFGQPPVLPIRGHRLRSRIASLPEDENIELRPKFEVDSRERSRPTRPPRPLASSSGAAPLSTAVPVSRAP
ncbi:hypothetical protein B0920_04510 [Massilia sp. KIM]|uniref:LysR substrate-binding domain-containing protein n=1 Tax=Massilia sp. KIM TaxID=1955422 RepID=UPI0009D58D67|nr:hypothetical protein B0920_04510 [Massilia sp. KIM]